MRRIAQRELRNDSAAVLRAAEDGEEFLITVDGRPVATLGPYRRRQFISAARVRELLGTPTDDTVLRDVRRRTDEQQTDPWSRQK